MCIVLYNSHSSLALPDTKKKAYFLTLYGKHFSKGFRRLTAKGNLSSVRKTNQWDLVPLLSCFCNCLINVQALWVWERNMQALEFGKGTFTGTAATTELSGMGTLARNGLVRKMLYFSSVENRCYRIWQKRQINPFHALLWVPPSVQKWLSISQPSSFIFKEKMQMRKGTAIKMDYIKPLSMQGSL